MAGDWIKFEHVTPDKPEVYAISADLGITPEAVVGHLLRVWIWADQQSLDGHAISVTNVTLDAVSRRDGFATAMRKVGWLGGSDGALELPNFDRHNGESAKKRVLATKRKQNQRSRNERDKSVTREEKRRDITPNPLEGEMDDSQKKKKDPEKWEPHPGLNLDAWAEFEAHRKEIRKPLTNLARRKAAKILIEFTPQVQQQMVDKSIASRWSGLFPPTNNHPQQAGPTRPALRML